MESSFILVSSSFSNSISTLVVMEMEVEVEVAVEALTANQEWCKNMPSDFSFIYIRVVTTFLNFHFHSGAILPLVPTCHRIDSDFCIFFCFAVDSFIAGLLASANAQQAASLASVASPGVGGSHSVAAISSASSNSATGDASFALAAGPAGVFVASSTRRPTTRRPTTTTTTRRRPLFNLGQNSTPRPTSSSTSRRPLFNFNRRTTTATPPPSV